jgi:nucleotide-binding universal stress UspA family protein
MAAWKRICCPIDFSAVSAFALEEAAEQAWLSGGALTLLHVCETPPPSAGETLASREAREQDAVAHERLLRNWEERARGMSTAVVDSVTISGDPATEIIRFADEKRYDLIIMGTHGRTGREQLPFGSVAQKVVLDAPCPVLVVHPRASRAVARSSAHGA